MDSSAPLVSIIVITYNSAKYVLETLESAKSQTYQNIELIISDDGSKDNTVEICKEWLQQNKERFVHTEMLTVEQNTGIPANCNRGVKVAKGEWVKIIAGDDVLFETCLENNISFSSENFLINAIHSDVITFSGKINKGDIKGYTARNNIFFNKKETSAVEQFEVLLRTNVVFAATVFLRRKVIITHEIFIEKYKLWEDRPAWLTLTQNGHKFYYLAQPTVYYRKSELSIMAKKKSNQIYSDFDIIRDGYLTDFGSFLPKKEQYYNKFEYQRKYYLNKFGLNRRNIFCKCIAKFTSVALKFFFNV